MAKGIRWTEEQLKEHLGNVAPIAKEKVKKKYGNVRTEYNGITFDSKKEAEFASKLDLDPTVLYYHRQVLLDLPAGIKMRLDFLVFYTDYTKQYYDVKGAPPTRDWLNKKKLAEATYPIKINIV